MVAVSAVEETPPVAAEVGVSPAKERPPPVAEEAVPPAPGAGRHAPARRNASGCNGHRLGAGCQRNGHQRPQARVRHSGRNHPEGVATGPVQGTESRAAPAGGEPGHDAGKDLGGAGPARNNKGGWATGPVGHNEKKSRSRAEAGVVVVEKGKTDSSNTTWREMRTRREIRS